MVISELMREASLAVGVDVGGTFTDLVARDSSDRLFVGKTPSTPDDPARAVITGLESLCAEFDLPLSSVTVVLHGTTVATNAVLQRRGARTALLTTLGFRDVLAIARQARPRLFDFDARRPEPLIPRNLRVEVTERISSDGNVITDVDTDEVISLIAALRESGVESVAVSFLHAYRNRCHEDHVKRLFDEHWPSANVSLSSDVLPEYREYERTSTTCVNAFVAPIMSTYLAQLHTGLVDAGCTASLLIMQSSGGLSTLENAVMLPASTVLSGVAAGAYGGARSALWLGRDLVLTLDIGGTSCDLALGEHGWVRTSRGSVVGGCPIRLPSLDIHTIGAGGGSIAYLDPGNAMRVGPRSAGALPGPACYGEGGLEPTVTDANLVLGRLPSAGLLGGRMPLRRDLAADAIDKIASPLGISIEEAAEGIVRVVNAAMARQMRVLTIERGVDPRDCSLVAFGGGGPVHAVELARELEMKEVLIPVAPGVTSALGLLLADTRADRLRTVLLELRDGPTRVACATILSNVFAELAADAVRSVSEAAEGDPTVLREVEMRYVRQGHEIRVPVPEGPLDEEVLLVLEEAFHAAHDRRFGYRHATEPTIIVTALVTALVPAVASPLSPATEAVVNAPVTQSDVWFGGRFHAANTLPRGSLSTGTYLEGPLILTQLDTTTVVPPEHSVEVQSDLSLLIRPAIDH